MKTIGQILKTKNANLLNLLNLVQATDNLAKIFHNFIDPELAPHCHFAKLEGSILTITVSNPAWATRVRYTIPELIKTIRTQPEFKNVTKIRYMVLGEYKKPIAKTKIPKLSAAHEKLWQEMKMGLKKR